MTLKVQEPTTEADTPENIEIVFPDGNCEVFPVEHLDFEEIPATSQTLEYPHGPEFFATS